MRNIPSLTLLVAALSVAHGCSDSTTHNNTGPVQTASYEKLEEFEDYAPVFSADGTKAVFLSNRVAQDRKNADGTAITTPLVYFYDAAAAEPLLRFDDRLGLSAVDGKETLVALNAAGNLLALNRHSVSAGSNQLIVAQADGGLRATLDLPVGSYLNELMFARGSDNFLAYVMRSAGVKTLKVVKIASDATAVTLSEIGSFAGQDTVSFQIVNNVPWLISFAAADTDLNRAALVQSFDDTTQIWTTAPGPFSAKLAQLERPYDVGGAGLFTFDRLATPKIRVKQGTGPTIGQDIDSEKVTVSDAIHQTDVFGTALSYDFTSATYLAAEPLSIAHASSSVDGQYLVLSALDAFTCMTSQPQALVQKLIRQSDGKMVSLTFARARGTLPWTDIVPSPCVVFDEGNLREIDATISQAEFIGRDGDFYLLALHSFATIDEEIRLARFKVDFDTGAFSEVTISEVSNNHR